MLVFVIVFLTLLNAVFAMAELSIASSRKARLQAMSDEGDTGARAALHLLAKPTQFLSTVQVGMVSIGVLMGIIGDAAFGEPVAQVLTTLGLGSNAAPIVATTLVVIFVTFITILFGELVPRRIGLMYPEIVARRTARPMLWVAGVAKPFIWLLTICTRGILKLLRIDESHQRVVTQEEIAASLTEGLNAGLIEALEHQMVRNVFHLDDRSLTSMMVPRAEIEWLDADSTVAEVLEQVTQYNNNDSHSWYPVCRGDLDDVKGIISVTTLLKLKHQKDDPIHQHVSAAQFVPETLSGMEMLEQLRAQSGRLALVVDEWGVVQGLMTPLDLLQAITGELKPDAGTDPWARALPDGRWILDGAMPVNELKSRLDIDELPLEEKNLYNTLAGLILAILGHLPVAGEKIECEDWTFHVSQMQGRRIDQILAQRKQTH